MTIRKRIPPPHAAAPSRVRGQPTSDRVKPGFFNRLKEWPVSHASDRRLFFLWFPTVSNKTRNSFSGSPPPAQAGGWAANFDDLGSNFRSFWGCANGRKPPDPDPKFDRLGSPGYEV